MQYNEATDAFHRGAGVGVGDRHWSPDQFLFFFLKISQPAVKNGKERGKNGSYVLINATSINMYVCAYVTYDLILKMELLGQIICIFRNVHTAT